MDIQTPRKELGIQCTQGIFDEIWGAWIADEIADVSSQLKQELRSKQRSNIVKIYGRLGISVQSIFLKNYNS